MLLITNDKLASLAPAWADFRGFTLLFDNPGPAYVTRGTVAYVQVAEDLAFYHALAVALTALDLDTLRQRYLFCALAPYSYHVTACDGGNIANCAQVSGAYRPALENFLQGLPHAVCAPNPFAEIIAQSALGQRPDWRIRLAFDHLANWSNVSLVATLMPVDAASAARLEAFVAARRDLCAVLAATFGIVPPPVFVPHITLGYFANPDAASGSAAHLPAWQAQLQHALHGLTLEFNTVSLYGFTDMETFFRCQPRT